MKIWQIYLTYFLRLRPYGEFFQLYQSLVECSTVNLQFDMELCQCRRYTFPIDLQQMFGTFMMYSQDSMNNRNRNIIYTQQTFRDVSIDVIVAHNCIQFKGLTVYNQKTRGNVHILHVRFHSKRVK